MGDKMSTERIPEQLKKEYEENSAVPYKVMNKIGAMHGNKETAKGREMEHKHEADMKTGKVNSEPMREIRIEIHREIPRFVKAWEPDTTIKHKQFGATCLPAQAKVLELPQLTKVLPCGKCGRELTVGVRVVMAFCPSCSQNLGVKK